MKLLPLTQGLCALVDDDDFDELYKHKWRVLRTKNNIYAHRSKKTHEGPRGSNIYLHRAVMNAPAGSDVDHENHYGLDCRKSNLRICTRPQNIRNRRGPNRGSLSGIRGVCWNRAKDRWVAQICVDGKRRTIGRFLTKEAAGIAYADEARKHFGEFAGVL